MFVIGLDVGTTGAKAVVADENGKIYGKGYRGYELNPRGGGIVEQNAEDWYTASAEAVRAASAAIPERAEIKAISVSTQGASMLAVDSGFHPLYPAITWMDSRSQREAEALGAAVGAEKIYRKSGWRLSPILDAAKIMWLRENATEVFQKAASFVSTLEYINRKLTGKSAIDPTNAAIRQLFDITSGRWDEELLSAVGITEDRLPGVYPTGEYLGALLPEAAEAFGLLPGIRVFNGAHDQYCAALGCGAVNAGDMLLSTGTTWTVLAVCSKLLYTPSFISPGIHPVGGRYGAMCSLISAGSALKWLSGLVGEDYASLDAGAEKCRESAAELFFYPYLAGAGFPHNRPDYRGTLSGLSLSHGRYDIARALMECVAFETKTVLEELEKSGVEVKKLKMVGGAAKSALWTELVRAVTDCEIELPLEPDSCCLGAAMIALVGLGVYPDYEKAAQAMVRYVDTETKRPESTAFYREKYEKYRLHRGDINRRFDV